MAAPAVQLVVRLRCALAGNDYVGFFRGVRGAPYLLACLVHAYFPAARAAAFAAICTGVSHTLECMTHEHVHVSTGASASTELLYTSFLAALKRGTRKAAPWLGWLCFL